LNRILVQSKKEGEKDADSEEYPHQPIPWKPTLPREPAKNNRNYISKTEGIRGSQQHLPGRTGYDGTRIGTQAQMKEHIGQCRQYKCNFFP
jgi:hypothetical protein